MKYIKTFENHNKENYNPIGLMKYLNYRLGEELFYIYEDDLIDFRTEVDDGPYETWNFDFFNVNILKNWFQEHIDEEVEEVKLFSKILTYLNDDKELKNYIENEELGLL